MIDKKLGGFSRVSRPEQVLYYIETKLQLQPGEVRIRKGTDQLYFEGPFFGTKSIPSGYSRATEATLGDWLKAFEYARERLKETNAGDQAPS